MKRATIERVLDAYDRIEEAEPDISTERLLAMTCDETGLDISAVVSALETRAIKEAP